MARAQKLTIEQHDEILKKLRRRVTHQELACEYHTSKFTIWRIGSGDWKRSYDKYQQQLKQAKLPPDDGGPPKWTGVVAWCEKCRAHVQQPCMACWSRAHAKPQDGHRYNDGGDFAVKFDLPAKAEERRKEIRRRAAMESE